MKLGICIPNYRAVATPKHLEMTIKRTEELGFDSEWFTDHVIMFDEYAPRFGGRTFYDPLATLCYAAGITTHILLGTSVIILGYRNPIVVAKVIATADQLSSGRVIFGCASGWAELEFKALGIPFEERGERADEYIQIMKILWTQDRCAFQGKFYSFSEVLFEPKPVQKPYPPVWVGGRSRRATRRAVEHGDVWHPTGMGLDELKQDIDYMRNLAARKGRSNPPEVTIRTRPIITTTRAEKRNSAILIGTPEQLVEQVHELEHLGVSHIVLDTAATSLDEYLHVAETFAIKIKPFV